MLLPNKIYFEPTELSFYHYASPLSPPILGGEQECRDGNSWTLFPLRSVIVSHQIKAVINKMVLPAPRGLLSPLSLSLAAQMRACTFVRFPSSSHSPPLHFFSPLWFPFSFLTCLNREFLSAFASPPPPVFFTLSLLSLSLSWLPLRSSG